MVVSHHVTSSSTVTLLIWACLTWFPSPTVQATCYNSKGLPWGFVQEAPVEQWMPCNTTAEVTHCCGPRDYCMSNGLCMDAVVDNIISQQGCTDKNWNSPCFNYCDGTESSAAGLHFLWRCNGQDHCCGTNATTSCCEDPGIETFHLNVAVEFHRPPKETTATSSTTASAATASTTPSATPEDTNSATPAPNESNDSPENSTRDMAIGLGIGIPLGLAIVGGLIFVGMQLRNRNQQASTPPAVQPGHYYHQEAYKPPTEMGVEISSYYSVPAELSSTRERAEL